MSDLRPGPLPPADEAGDIHKGPLRPAAPDSEIVPGPLARASDESEIHRGPLETALVDEAAYRPQSTVDERPPVPVGRWRGLSRFWARRERALSPVSSDALIADRAAAAKPARPAKYRKTWREQRWERRRRRVWFEEVLGWVLVPIILIGLYVGIKGVLAALGTTPTALIQGIQTALSGRS